MSLCFCSRSDWFDDTDFFRFHSTTRHRLDESVSSKQAEGLRKAEDGFRAIRVIRALKHVPLKNTLTNKFQNKNRRFPMKKTAVYGWENGGL